MVQVDPNNDSEVATLTGSLFSGSDSFDRPSRRLLGFIFPNITQTVFYLSYGILDSRANALLPTTGYRVPPLTGSNARNSMYGVVNETGTINTTIGFAPRPSTDVAVLRYSLGWDIYLRWGISLNPTGSRCFVGLGHNTLQAGNVAAGSVVDAHEPSTPTGVRDEWLGVGFDSTSAATSNWFIYSANQAAGLNIDTGIQRNTNDIFELRLYAPMTSSYIDLTFRNVTSGTEYTRRCDESDIIPSRGIPLVAQIAARRVTGVNDSSPSLGLELFVGEAWEP